MAVLDDDLYGMIGRYLQGMEVTDETLALDLIHSVGPLPGSFLDTEHTRKWWRREQYMPRVADRLSPAEWERKGKRSAVVNAQERVKQILASHEVPPLSKEQDREIDRILDAAKRHYRERGLL